MTVADELKQAADTLDRCEGEFWRALSTMLRDRASSVGWAPLEGNWAVTRHMVILARLINSGECPGVPHD